VHLNDTQSFAKYLTCYRNTRE